MLLTETIKNSTSAIQNRRSMLERKQSAETYAKALAKLAQATESMKETLDCATAMKDSGIVRTPLMDETTRDELLACINDCGNGVSQMELTLDAVRLLKSKGDTVATQVKIIWRDAAREYSEGTKGYLSMIGGLSNDPGQARELANNIEKAVLGDPSIKAINSLVSNVTKAQKLIETFSLNPEIEEFLKKVSTQRATIFDLTPSVLTWLKEKGLTGKLKIRF